MERYCTKCGKLATKQSDSLYQCELGHENWINPAAGSVVFVLHDDKVLYGVRSIEPNKGKLCLPGGFIEVGDTAEETAIREVKEEMGIDVELVTCLGTYANTYNGRPALSIVFIATGNTDAIVTSSDMDGGEPIWREVDNLPVLEEVGWEWYDQAHKDLLAWCQAQKQA